VQAASGISQVMPIKLQQQLKGCSGNVFPIPMQILKTLQMTFLKRYRGVVVARTAEPRTADSTENPHPMLNQKDDESMQNCSRYKSMQLDPVTSF
jgi:hypothetical protein